MVKKKKEEEQKIDFYEIQSLSKSISNMKYFLYEMDSEGFKLVLKDGDEHDEDAQTKINYWDFDRDLRDKIKSSIEEQIKRDVKEIKKEMNNG